MDAGATTLVGEERTHESALVHQRSASDLLAQ
jgi:hypothetical protein